MEKQAILQNLRDAHDILSKVEEPIFKLSTFKKELSCGTIACAAGWLAMSERFAPIMKLVPFGVQTPNAHHFFNLRPADWVEGTVEDSAYYFGWLDGHFGPHAFDMLFCERGGGMKDLDHPMAERDEDDEDECVFPDSVTDKDLALWRIRQQIAAIEGSAE